VELAGVGDRTVRVHDAGGSAFTVTRTAAGAVCAIDGFTAPPVAKTPDRAGPLKEALTTPFIIVYGTGGDADRRARVKAHAERLAEAWKRFTRSAPRMTPDTRASAAWLKRFTLVLVGTPGTNSVLAGIAKKLPFALDDDSVTVAGDRYDLEQNGLLLTYPSPFADRPRYVVVAAGVPWGTALPRNHQWDFVPDYAVFRAPDPIDAQQQPASTFKGENPIVRAGFFGPRWEFDPKLDWKAPPRPAAAP